MTLILYWISPSLEPNRQPIIAVLSSMSHHIREVATFGEKGSINIGTIHEVKKSFGKQITHVSDRFVFDLQREKIKNLQFIKPGTQYLSLCLSPLTISSTGFDNHHNMHIAKITTLLGGIFQHRFSEDTTLVVTNTSLSQTYYSAAKNGLPIVSIEWIDACYKNISRVPLDSYRIPCFFNITFTTTDLSLEMKKECKRLIISNGGKVSDRLDDTTTFLISESLCMTSKIKTALNLQLLIVKPRWISACVATVCPANEYVFNWWHIDGFVKTKIFEGASFAIEKKIASKELVAIIHANGGSISDMKNAQYVVLPSSIPRKMTPQNPHAVMVTPWWVWQCISLQEIINPCSFICYQPIVVLLPVDGLSGKVIYVHRIKEGERNNIIHMLRESGATVIHKFSLHVAFIICGTVDAEFFDQAYQYAIPVLKVEWVLELYQTGKIPNLISYSANQNDSHLELQSLCVKIKRGTIDNDTNSNLLNKTSTPIDIKSIEFSQNVISSSDSSNEDVTYISKVEKPRRRPQKPIYNPEISMSSGDIELSSSGSQDPLLRELSK